MSKKYPQIHTDLARRHLSLLDPNGVDFIWLITDDGPGIRKAAACWGPLDDLYHRFEREQRDGFAIHVCVNAMRSCWRRNCDALQTRAIFAEMDGPVVRPFPLPPSLEIKTSPGKRHLYWLTDPADPPTPTEATGMLRRIAHYHGADRNAADISRVLRLAGTWHQKFDPRRVMIESDSGHRFSRAELLAAFPPPRSPVRTRPSPQSGPPARRDKLGHAYLAAAVRGVSGDLSRSARGTRNSTLNRAAFRLGQLGITLEEATTALTPIALDIGLLVIIR